MQSRRLLVGLALVAVGACHRSDSGSSGSAAVLPATDSATTSAGGPCQAPQLAADLGAQDAGMGHRTVRIHWRNTADTPCRLAGYPVVALIDSANAVVAVRVDTVDGSYLTGSHTVAPVMLEPHGIAVFDVGWTVVAGEAGGCLRGVALRVAPSGAAPSAGTPSLRTDVTACGAHLTVTPIVALDSLTPGERDQ